MNIRLHIERLVLDGLPLSGNDSVRVPGAVQQELGRLLHSEKLRLPIASGGSTPGPEASTIRLSKSANAASIGRQVAAAVYSGIGERR
jgi:hypothetical protein